MPSYCLLSLVVPSQPPTPSPAVRPTTTCCAPLPAEPDNGACRNAFRGNGACSASLQRLCPVTCGACRACDTPLHAMIISASAARFRRARAQVYTAGFSSALWIPAVFGNASACPVGRRGVENLLVAHRNAWAHVASLGVPMAIFEDDVLFLGARGAMLVDIARCNTLPRCLLYLGVWNQWMTTHALYVTPLAAAAMLRKFDGRCVHPAKGADHVLRSMCLTNESLHCKNPSIVLGRGRRGVLGRGYFGQDRLSIEPLLHDVYGKDVINQ